MQRPEIHELAKDIILGQMRLVVAMMDIEEIKKRKNDGWATTYRIPKK